jgi:hypothetical protein
MGDPNNYVTYPDIDVVNRMSGAGG